MNENTITATATSTPEDTSKAQADAADEDTSYRDYLKITDPTRTPEDVALARVFSDAYVGRPGPSDANALARVFHRDSAAALARHGASVAANENYDYHDYGDNEDDGTSVPASVRVAMERLIDAATQDKLGQHDEHLFSQQLLRGYIEAGFRAMYDGAPHPHRLLEMVQVATHNLAYSPDSASIVAEAAIDKNTRDHDPGDPHQRAAIPATVRVVLESLIDAATQHTDLQADLLRGAPTKYRLVLRRLGRESFLRRYIECGFSALYTGNVYTYLRPLVVLVGEATKHAHNVPAPEDENDD